MSWWNPREGFGDFESLNSNTWIWHKCCESLTRELRMALILVVEDEHLLRWSIVRRFENLGHTVHSASSVAQAEAMLAKAKPEFVVLDLRLPDGHGLDFLERSQRELCGVPVLVMSAVLDPGEEARAVALGVCGVMTKPVSHNDLVRIFSLHANPIPPKPTDGGQ